MDMSCSRIQKLKCMGKKMNKTEFIKLLSYKTKLDLEDAEIVNKIL